MTATQEKVVHTPGPWRIGTEGWSKGIILGSNRIIATVENLHDNLRPESQANASLLAAAPTMLTELIEAEAYITECGGDSNWRTEVLNSLRAAIAKATG